MANELSKRGYDVVGVDPSDDGIRLAHEHYSNLRLYQRSAEDSLAEEFGQFPIVVNLEVVEHVYLPRLFASTLFSLVETGGYAIVSAPFHGYFKNLALAVTGKMDQHFTALWDGGHIKFWSVKTLQILLLGAGFTDVKFFYAGRVPVFVKSMIALARKIEE